MTRAAWIALGLGLAAPAGAEEIVVPSGQPVTLQDVIWGIPGPEGLTVRFRFIAPEIARDGGSIDFDTASADMEYLCNTYALPRVETLTGPTPEEIVIAFSDIPVEFGTIAPEATQFFEAFSVEDGICILEAF
ncbi:MAG: DUF6497 family protein [Gemmobacter sp.]